MADVLFDYSKLRGRIVEKFGTNKEFAAAMGWSNATNSKKLTCVVMWTQDEIVKATDLLELRPADIKDYFFTQKVKAV